MLLLIRLYEYEHYPPVLPPERLSAIRIKMEARGLKGKDLVGKIGSKGYVSALLNGKKPLTLAKLSHRELGIPASRVLG